MEAAMADFVHNRRILLGGIACVVAAPAWASTPSAGQLRFAVFRNGARVGEHVMGFTQAGAMMTATSEVHMAIRVGPVPVFRYTHSAREQWRDGRFVSLETSTSSNGKREKVSARRGDGGVRVETLTGQTLAPDNAAPLTHWNTKAFAGPMFNPQTGRMVKATAKHMSEGHWTVRGEAEIDDWYEDGVWSALKGRLPDRSLLEYRRL
jgi:hypothetical protein